MIIYGLNPVLEALRADRSRVHYVGVGREHGKNIQKVLAEARRLGVPVRQLPPEQLDRLAGGGVHNGVMADLAQGSYADFEAIVSREATTFVLILDGIQDPQNFGAVLRVAEGFGVDLVVIPEHESAGLSPAAVKASAGASEWVPLAQVTNLARAIERLQKEGFWVYAAAVGGDPVAEVDFRGKVAIVLGSEGKGIRRNVLEHCDRTISIPMQGHVASLNVATAAAVICYEVSRQTIKPSVT